MSRWKPIKPGYFILVFLAIFFCTGPGPLQALDPAKTLGQYHHQVYLTEDGLPQSSIITMAFSSDGYLWLGTYEGLARFDGIRFKIFDRFNTPEMAGNRIKIIMEDNQKILWIGTSNGLLSYRRGKFKNYTRADGLSNDFVVCLAQDGSGSLWVGTTNGLNRFDGKTFTNWARELDLADTYISALAYDNKGRLWIGTSGKGLYVLEKERLRHVISAAGLTGTEDIRVMHCAPNGELWAGLRGKGLLHIKDDKPRLHTTAGGLSGNDIRALLQDNHGCLWIGTNGQGLNRFKAGAFSSANFDEALLNRSIRSFAADPEGNLWVGTRDGLCQLKNGKFILYNKGNGLAVNSTRTVYQDTAGDTWIGTVNGGLVRFRENRFRTFGRKDGLTNLHIWTIDGSGDGSIWFGTYGGGLYQLKNNKIVRTYTTRNGLSNNVIRAVKADRRDFIWAGSNGGGVDVIAPGGKIVNYNSQKGLSDDFVYAINEDNNGFIWIGTYQGNLNRLEKSSGEITVYRKLDGLPGHAIWSIYPDKEDNETLWLGTDGGGLVRFRKGECSIFSDRNGLYSDLAFVVTEDARGNLWMNCNRGIYFARKKDLNDFAGGIINRIPSGSFGKSQGIKSTECSGPAQPAGIVARNGTLWFPTNRGMVVLDPENISINQTKPPVLADEIRVDGKVVYTYPQSQKTTLVVKPGASRIVFKYSGISFTAPEQVRFRYKLAGFDENWMDAGTDRSVSYTHIDPGNYTFRVIACNNDGIWNDEGVRIRLTIQPFFWQMLWFQLLGLLLFAFLSYWLINFVKHHIHLTSFWKKKSLIGPYKLEEQIGAGGMGLIYRVRSLMDTTKTYAMKVMKEEHLTDKLQQKRFKNEANLVDRMAHPNIVKIYERGEHNGQHYIVMELLEGDTLAQRIQAGNFPGVLGCLHIMKQVADILVVLADENIIHRDLKPENIMLIEKEGTRDFVKLLDFGIARFQSVSHLTETGMVLGTLGYMPPEALSGEEISPAADVYSLGIIGYILLTREEPFKAPKPVDTMRLIIKYFPPEPMGSNPNVPPKLNDLIMNMIEKKPELRPTAEEVTGELKNLIDELTENTQIFPAT